MFQKKTGGRSTATFLPLLPKKNNLAIFFIAFANLKNAFTK